MRSDIVPGGAFPDHELADHTGNLRKAQRVGPMPVRAELGHSNQYHGAMEQH